MEYSNECNDSILLNEVDSENFDKILEYLNHYKDKEPKEIPKPFPKRTDEVFFRSILDDDWTFNFLQSFSIDEAINLVNCSNYLQIDGLVNLLAAKIAYEMCNGDYNKFKFGMIWLKMKLNIIIKSIWTKEIYIKFIIVKNI